MKQWEVAHDLYNMIKEIEVIEGNAKFIAML
jgi:hypothetical protein